MVTLQIIYVGFKCILCQGHCGETIKTPLKYSILFDPIPFSKKIKYLNRVVLFVYFISSMSLRKMQKV